MLNQENEVGKKFRLEKAGFWVGEESAFLKDRKLFKTETIERILFFAENENQLNRIQVFQLDYIISMHYERAKKNRNLSAVHYEQFRSIGKIGVKFAKNDSMVSDLSFGVDYVADYFVCCNCKSEAEEILLAVCATPNLAIQVFMEIEDRNKKFSGMKVSNNISKVVVATMMLNYLSDENKEKFFCNHIRRELFSARRELLIEDALRGRLRESGFDFQTMMLPIDKYLFKFN